MKKSKKTIAKPKPKRFSCCSVVEASAIPGARSAVNTGTAAACATSVCTDEATALRGAPTNVDAKRPYITTMQYAAANRNGTT
eukprot:CAMPEP_0172841440 /NCGR_PEP_ID=MMETSP1075-20121228/29990_1 /TAXON_ID=2916 /ORGANISM="Ceratium fusus, Strain PA161109" /LENGTH=82 /DNA_ID=CAMNT_0013685413 /DNA_START=95 /DNA_END=340 /DNA_ORIENTATION=+